MHLIPADKTVLHDIERARAGDIVTFDGACWRWIR
jgi:hypothetical protein